MGYVLLCKKRLTFSNRVWKYISSLVFNHESFWVGNKTQYEFTHMNVYNANITIRIVFLLKIFMSLVTSGVYRGTLSR